MILAPQTTSHVPPITRHHILGRLLKHATIHRHVRPIRTEAPALTIAPASDFNHLYLQSYVREYRVVFSGVVTCGGMPCAASIELSLNSAQNPDLHRKAHTSGDGHYEILIPLSENIHEHIDWKLTVDNGRSDVNEIHGRQILTDDANLSVEDNFSL